MIKSLIILYYYNERVDVMNRVPKNPLEKYDKIMRANKQLISNVSWYSPLNSPIQISGLAGLRMKSPIDGCQFLLLFLFQKL